MLRGPLRSGVSPQEADRRHERTNPVGVCTRDKTRRRHRRPSGRVPGCDHSRCGGRGRGRTRKRFPRIRNSPEGHRLRRSGRIVPGAFHTKRARSHANSVPPESTANPAGESQPSMPPMHTIQFRATTLTHFYIHMGDEPSLRSAVQSIRRRQFDVMHRCMGHPEMFPRPYVGVTFRPQGEGTHTPRSCHRPSTPSNR